MRKILVIVLLITFGTTNAQIDFFNNYFFDCLESSFTKNYAITLASPKGDLIKANELLNSDYFQSNPKEALLIKVLLIHNTLGKNKAFDFISDSKIAPEEQDYAKLWLDFYTHDTIEYDSLKAVFKQKYPTNYNPIKLKLRALLDYRDSNIWNQIKERKTNSLSTIDSLLTNNTLSTEDNLYFSLMKLDFLSKKDFRSEEEYPKEKLLNELATLYQKNKNLFRLEALKSKLNDSKTDDFKELLKQINEDINKKTIGTSTEKVLNILIKFNNGDDKPTVGAIESFINKILVTEKNTTEINKIKALLTVFSLSKEPDLGFMMRGMLKPIPFSKSFKQVYASASTKQSILNNIDAILKDPQFEEVLKENELSSKMKNNLETLKNLSVEDLQAVYGMTVFSIYYTKSLLGLKYAFGNYQDRPSSEEKSDIKKYCEFLEKNPLYLNDSSFNLDLLTINSDADLFKFIDLLNSTKAKLPGAAPIVRNGIMCLNVNLKIVDPPHLSLFYKNYFKLVVDYLNVSKIVILKNEDFDFDFFAPLTEYRKNNYSSYFKNVFNLLSNEDKIESENYLNTVLSQNPNQEDLKKIKLLINTNK